MKDCLDALRATADMRPLDVHLAQFATSFDAQASLAVAVATAFASRAAGLGDVCATLADCQTFASQHPEIACPSDISAWRDALSLSLAVQSNDADNTALVVLDHADRLYLSRFYQHEQSVAAHLKRSQGALENLPDMAKLQHGLELLFPVRDALPDWQRVAAAIAIRQRFCVISGGPGTGKTRTVARLLCLLQYLSDQPLRLALAAPTGKAAARLAQSIQREIPELSELLPEAAAQVPTQAGTLHRLLGYRSDGSYRHNEDNPLLLDLLLVDEASMLDLSMMARLLAALPTHARLVFLGDRDQLASVEAGNVLGDICAEHFDFASADMLAYLAQLSEHAVESLELSQDPIADSICLLRRSYRFAHDSSVGGFARAINTGNWPDAQTLLKAAHSDLIYLQAEQQDKLGERLVQHFRALLKCDNAQQALQQLSHFQLLCALRKGPAGVEELNLKMHQVLRRAGVISAADNHKGRPIMVLQNDYAQGLYNGDVGLFWPNDDGELVAWFDDGQGGLRSVLPARLPEHESCFAMTIHKTQGSEFKQVCILLPEQPAPILTRQLLYTAVTRAREAVTVVGPSAVVKYMIETSLQRQSGLRDALALSQLSDELRSDTP